MKKIVLFVLLISQIVAFDNMKIKSLMGEDKYNTYNKLLDKIFTKKDYSIYQTISILKDNGLLELFFNNAKMIHTKFIFDKKNTLNTKILNDSLYALGYYYFYPYEIDYDKKYSITIEFKSEHFIDPVSLSDEFKSRGCELLDINRSNNVFNYHFNCEQSFLKEAKPLKSKYQRFIKSNGVYWISSNDFSKIKIKTRKIDYWHPSVWFYDDNLNLINYFKQNNKTTKLTLNIPKNCAYIKITDIYNAENFKRGITIKGLQ